jgi:hypothetical protein
MTPFEYLSVALSFVSGLAVAIVLTSTVRAFRARGHSQMDWVPFVWAASILLIQFQTWWAMLRFRALDEWIFWQFGLVTLLMVTSFVASALVLPDDSVDYPISLRAYFDRDGRWAVAAMAVQLPLAVTVNVFLNGAPFTNPFHLVNLVLFVTCVALLVSSTRRVVVVATLVFGAGTVLAMIAQATSTVR